MLLIGGGARNGAVRRIAPEIFGLPIDVPPPSEYVADGAARQAAWVLRGELPGWTVDPGEQYLAEATPATRAQYSDAQRASGLRD